MSNKPSSSKHRKSHHAKKTKSSRVRYNPSTSSIENPEIKYGNDNMGKIIEKLIVQVDALENTVATQNSEISRLKKKVRSLDNMSGRVTMLEADIVTNNRELSGMRNNIAINTFDSHADEDLREYMMNERTKDATDTMMSGHEIGAKLEDMKQRRRNHGMQ